MAQVCSRKKIKKKTTTTKFQTITTHCYKHTDKKTFKIKNWFYAPAKQITSAKSFDKKKKKPNATIVDLLVLFVWPLSLNHINLLNVLIWNHTLSHFGQFHRTVWNFRTFPFTNYVFVMNLSRIVPVLQCRTLYVISYKKSNCGITLSREFLVFYMSTLLQMTYDELSNRMRVFVCNNIFESFLPENLNFIMN